MPLLDRIKATIFGSDPAPSRPIPPEDRPYDDEFETYQARTAREPSVSTPADDPVLDDVAAAGVQPVSKPHEIEAAQNPARSTHRSVN